MLPETRWLNLSVADEEVEELMDLPTLKNGVPIVHVNREGEIMVVLPEGIRVMVLPADSGLRVRSTVSADSAGGLLVALDACRISPAPTLLQSACPECSDCGMPDGPARLTRCGHAGCLRCGS